MMREIVSSLYTFMLRMDDRIEAFDCKIAAIFKASAVCQRIAKIRGIGPKTATAMIAAIVVRGCLERFRYEWFGGMRRLPKRWRN
jgi:transposase